MFVSLGFSIAIVNGTFYVSFFQAAISSVLAATVTWRKKQRTSFRGFFSGPRFKSRVDLQDKGYLD